MMRLNIIIIFCSFLMLSCGQNDTQQSTQDPLWDLESQVLEKGKNIEIEEINKSINKASSMRLSWAYSPVTIAFKIAGQQMISPEIKILAKSLSGNELITHVVVMVEKKNLPDDSLNDEYYRIELKLGGSLWEVTDIKTAWNCKANRGHSEVNAVICK